MYKYVVPLGLYVFVLGACGSTTSAPATTATAVSPQPDSTDATAFPVGSNDAPPTTAASSSLAPALQTVLNDHNAVRAKHCAAPLRWSAALERSAKAWATKLTTNGCGFEHSGGDYGENLAAGTSPLSPSRVTAMWYEEISDYNWSKPAFAMNTGHFTQVIWADTTDLGCAVASCNGNDVWVCQYLPYGNVEGEYSDQVKPVCQ